MRAWLCTSVLLAIGGIIGCGISAQSVAADQVADARDALVRSSNEMSTVLQLALQHQADLVVNTSAVVIADPNETQQDFATWLDSARVLRRYPEVIGLGFIVAVPRAGSTECLSKLGFIRDSSLVPADHNWCAHEEVATSSAATGLDSYSPLTLDDRSLLSINVPIYRGGGVPPTVEERRTDFLGWVGTISDPQVLLDQALAEQQGIAISLTYTTASTVAVFTAGVHPHSASSTTTDLSNGWTVTTSRARIDDGIWSSKTAIALLLTGTALSVVLSALVFVLGTGRGRAVQLVAERTGELRHQALHDDLTGLPNRALITDRIEQLLVRNRRERTEGAALYVDLDDFKNVNDTLGHEAGDQLLVAVATRLTATLRDADTIGRMGGDEFVVLLDGSPSKLAAELVAQRIVDVMRQPFDIDGISMPLQINPSIGIAIGDRASGSELLRDADVALYQAKAFGKNRYQIFHPDMQTTLLRRVELEIDLRTAARSNQLRLVYQPIYDLGDLTLQGVEALLRWDHPTLGPITPDEFIPILERSGLITDVGRWVLIEACQQMAAWHSRGHDLELSVNVSGRQLDDDRAIDDVKDALAISGLDPRSLIIEVTETALMRNVASTAARLRAIRDLGIRISVDDFGTGYSSLAYLQQFPVNSLKIDRRFISAIGSSSESRALIRTLVQLGRDLGLTTLAEGVETADELDHCRNEKVDQIQGFLLSRPLDPISLEAQILALTGVVRRVI
jgi:diguanylate cyclase (GGDEF)-like protein